MRFCTILLDYNREKSQNEKFLAFFSAFRLFVQNRKKSTFFRFICSASLIDSYQKSVDLDFLRCLSIGDLLVTCIWIWRLVPLIPGLFHYGVFWKWYQRNTESSESKQKIQGDQQFLQAKFSGSENRLFRKKLALILFQTRGNQNEWTGDRYYYSRLRERGKLPRFVRREINNMLVEAIVFLKFQARPTFGRKMMTGYVRSKGLTLSGKQASKSLRRANPVNHTRRREDTVRDHRT